MSTPYQGTPSNVTVGLAATVTGATNATPIVITTSAAHLYSTGDKVSVTGVLGNTAANGVWTITVLSSTTFSLTGSVGSGAYTAGGTTSDQFMTPPFQIPSDGDTFNAAAFNAAYQMLADRSQLLGQNLILKKQTFTASGTFTAPAGCVFALLIGWGGGGGGGSGNQADTTSANYYRGGGGGGGAALVVNFVTLVPGTSYSVTIAAGGTGGSGGINGVMGGDTIFGSLATFPGATGGGAPNAASTSTTITTLGGRSVSPGGGGITFAAWACSVGNDNVDFINGVVVPRSAGDGGLGRCNVSAPFSCQSTAQAGMHSFQRFAGGAAGVAASDATRHGGGGGGGGGGGPGGVGADGGGGGAAINIGAGSAGSSGNSAAANSGAGGGGGGAGGGGSASGGAGGAGGAGGSGQLTVIYVSLG